MQCEVHGIAAGPDGLCALCHAAQKAQDRREGARLGWILFLGLGLLSAGLLGAQVLGRSAHQSRVARAEPRPSLRPPAPAMGAPPAASQAEPALTEALTAHEAPAPVESALAATAQEAPLPTAAASAVAEASTAPSVAVATRAPTPAELRAALVATPISIYTAAWCGACRKAHAFLDANGLHYRDIDVDESPGALRELKSRSGGTAIPVIEVDGKLLRAGFSERLIERALAESVEHRLGIRGVRLQATAL
ncbi:MAG TPA: glutaredoxin family protein [Polyangiaceae bacterium]|nr:glutaredoxin family protein [Polyangiaceae bacterium]